MRWREFLVGAGIIALLLSLMLVGLRDVNLRYMLAGSQAAPTFVAPLPALIVTPGSEVAALRQVVETQQVQINDLNRDLAKFKEDQQREGVDIRWVLDSKLWLAGALASVAGLLGWSAYNTIGDKVRERVQASLDEVTMGYDPAYVPVYFPKGQSYDSLRNRLTSARLKKIRPYSETRLAPNPGITVVIISGGEQLDDFIDFLGKATEAKDLDANEMCFVLYTGTYQIPKAKFDQILSLHQSLTTANTPVTLVSHIFNLGRGLRGDRPQKSD